MSYISDSDAPWQRRNYNMPQETNMLPYDDEFNGNIAYADPVIMPCSINPGDIRQDICITNPNSYIPNPQHNAIGTVTKFNNDCGLINEEVFFHRNVCKNGIPRIGDRVVFDAIDSATGVFKWNAIRVQFAPQIKSLMSLDVRPVSPPMNYDGGHRDHTRKSLNRGRREQSREKYDDDYKKKRIRKNHNRSRSQSRESDVFRRRRRSRRSKSQTSARSLTHSGTSNTKNSQIDTKKRQSTASSSSAKDLSFPEKRQDLSASNRAYRIRIQARRILARFKGFDLNELNEEERNRLQWAKENINVRPPSSPMLLSNTTAPKATKIDTSNAKKTRKSAAAILKRFKDSDISKLSEVQKESLKWAQENINAQPPLSSNALPETQKEADKTKPVKNCLTWAVIDSSNSDYTISPANWKLVQMALLKIFKDIVLANPGPPPICRDAGWYKGVFKLMTCSDERSAVLFKQAIDMLGEVWPGAKLQAVPEDEIPKRPSCKACVPIEPSTPKGILELLKLSNPELPTDGWNVTKISEPKDDFCEIVILLNEESLKPLNECNGVINYGFGSISLEGFRVSKVSVKQEKPEYNTKKNKGQSVLDVSSDDGDSVIFVSSDLKNNDKTATHKK